MNTVRIAGTAYAVGLWWQVRSGGPATRKTMLRLARTTAESFASEGYNYVTIRAQQYGLGRYETALPGKTLSLASAFRPLGGQDAFLGVFRLADDLWWVCGIVRGMIAADGDAVFTTEAAARTAASSLRLLIEDVGVTEVTCDSLEASLEYLVPKLWPDSPLFLLHDTGKRQRMAWFGLGGLALLAVGFGAYWLYGEYQAREEARLAALRTAVRSAERKNQLAHPEQYFRQAWRDAPLVVDAGGQCAEAILSLPAAANAWTLEESSCAPGTAAASLTLTWGHNKGASFVDPPGSASASARLVSPSQAVETRPLGILPARGADSPLLARERAESVLYQITQNTGSQLAVSWETPEQFRLDNETTVSAPWQRGTVTLSSLPAAAFLGRDLFDALALPGVMLTTVTRQNSTWTIKGYIYVVVPSK